jgi:hypothetical protein
MAIYTSTPYTYLIGWTSHNKWYYGVRYSSKCHPSDLWVTYFTSSKRVQEMREQCGEPDIIQVRKTFSTPKSAVLWEERVLKRMQVKSDDKFLNSHEGGGPPIIKMYGSDNPQTRPEQRKINSIRSKKRAAKLKQEGRRANGTLIEYFVWVCEHCKKEVIRVDNVRNRQKRFCDKSCAITHKNLNAHSNKITKHFAMKCEHCGAQRQLLEYKHNKRKRFCSISCARRGRK